MVKETTNGFIKETDYILISLIDRITSHIDPQGDPHIRVILKDGIMWQCWGDITIDNNGLTGVFKR